MTSKFKWQMRHIPFNQAPKILKQLESSNLFTISTHEWANFEFNDPKNLKLYAGAWSSNGTSIGKLLNSDRKTLIETWTKLLAIS